MPYLLTTMLFKWVTSYRREEHKNSWWVRSADRKIRPKVTVWHHETLPCDAKQWSSHRMGGNLKLMRESTNADRKRLKIAFPIANCRFRLLICNLKHCFNAYRSALLDSRDSLLLPPVRCDPDGPVFLSAPNNHDRFFFAMTSTTNNLTTWSFIQHV